MVFAWLILLLVTIFFLFVEWKIDRKIKYSPIFFFNIPFLVLVLLYFLTYKIFGYIELNFKLIWAWMIASLVFYLSSLLMKCTHMYTHYSIKQKYKSKCSDDIKKISHINLFFSIIILMRAIYLIFYKEVNLFSKEELPALLAQGIFGYIRIFMLISTMYLMCSLNKKNVTLYSILSVAFSIMALYMYHIKGIFLLPLVSSVIYKYLFEGKKLPIKMVFQITILIFIAFYAAYSMPYVFSKQMDYIFTAEFLNKIGNKILSYLFSGILGFSGNYENVVPHEEWYIIISPIYNFLVKFIGENSINFLTAYFVHIGAGVWSNVFTVPGYLLFFSNSFGLLVYMLILGGVIYFVRTLALREDSTQSIRILYSLLMYLLMMSVFDFLYNQAYILITICILLLLHFVEKRNKKIIKIKFR